MKNGEKLEGNVLREEGDNYVIEVQVTTRIRDEKLVPRAEVLKIERVPEFEKAYAIIADLCPAPELLSVQGYEERINKLREFIEAFPKSPRSPVVEEMIKRLEEEMALIKGARSSSVRKSFPPRIMTRTPTDTTPSSPRRGSGTR